jgi:hypothetical protein
LSTWGGVVTVVVIKIVSGMMAAEQHCSARFVAGKKWANVQSI